MNRSTAAPSPEDFIRAIVEEVERRLRQGVRLDGGDLLSDKSDGKYNRQPLAGGLTDDPMQRSCHL